MRTYVFLSQVVSFTDARLQRRDYLYFKALAAFTKVSGDDVAVDAGSLVELTHPDLGPGRMVDDILAYVDSIEAPTGLVGWSSGAYLAFTLAARQPDAVDAVDAI